MADLAVYAYERGYVAPVVQPGVPLLPATASESLSAREVLPPGRSMSTTGDLTVSDALEQLSVSTKPVYPYIPSVEPTNYRVLHPRLWMANDLEPSTGTDRTPTVSEVRARLITTYGGATTEYGAQGPRGATQLFIDYAKTFAVDCPVTVDPQVPMLVQGMILSFLAAMDIEWLAANGGFNTTGFPVGGTYTGGPMTQQELVRRACQRGQYALSFGLAQGPPGWKISQDSENWAATGDWLVAILFTYDWTQASPYHTWTDTHRAQIIDLAVAMMAAESWSSSGALIFHSGALSTACEGRMLGGLFVGDTARIPSGVSATGRSYAEEVDFLWNATRGERGNNENMGGMLRYTMRYIREMEAFWLGNAKGQQAAGWMEGGDYSHQAHNTHTHIQGQVGSITRQNLVDDYAPVAEQGQYIGLYTRPWQVSSAVQNQTHCWGTNSGDVGLDIRYAYRTIAYATTGTDATKAETAAYVISAVIQPYPKTANSYLCYWPIFRFITGHEARFPSPRAFESLGVPLVYDAGLHGVLARTGLSGSMTSDETCLWMYTPTRLLSVGGHGSIQHGTFTLDKYGALICQGGNGKTTSVGTVAANVKSRAPGRPRLVIVHPDDIDSTAGSNGSIGPAGTLDLTAPLYDGGPDTVQTLVGAFAFRGIFASRRDVFDATDYLYSRYDHPAAYAGSEGQPTTSPIQKTVPLLDRTFLYYHPAGGGEYLVLVDRCTAQNATTLEALEKRVQFPSPRQWWPTSGSWTTLASGPTKGGDPDGGGIFYQAGGGPFRMINDYLGCHGVVFAKCVYPATSYTYCVGGDTFEYYDFYNNNPTGTTGYQALSKAHIFGKWRLEFRSCVNGADLLGYGVVPSETETFVTVLQWGDSQVLTSMAPVSTIAFGPAVTRSVGVRITDTTGAVLAVITAKDQQTHAFATAPLTMTTAAGTRHLVCDLTPGSRYYWVRSGGDVIFASADAGGMTAVDANTAGVADFQG